MYVTDQNTIAAELDALQAEVDALKCLRIETTAELDTLLPSIPVRGEKLIYKHDSRLFCTL